MTIFPILTAMFLPVLLLGGTDIPTGYVKIGPEHAIPWRIPERMTVEVKDGDDKALAGATLELVATIAPETDEKPTEKKFHATADAKGLARFDLKSLQNIRPWYVRLKIETENHAPLSASWQTNNDVKETETVVPEKLAASMLRTEPIEGVVVDEEGKPIEGVEVEIHITVAQRGDFRVELPWEIKRTTDAEGRWRFEAAPAGVKDSAVQLELRHPEFMPIHDWSGNDEKRLSYHRKTMLRGKSLEGRVVDEQGRPIAGAKVTTYTEDRNDLGFHSWGVVAETGEDGRFRLAGLGSLTKVLDVEAADKVDRRVEFPDHETEKHRTLDDIVLETAHSIRLRFVDDKGNPVPNVHCWSERSYFVSDAEGRMTVRGVPKEGRALSFWGLHSKVGRGAKSKVFAWKPIETENGKTYIPGDEEQIVAMTRAEVPPEPESAEMGRSGRTDQWELPEKVTLRVVDTQGKAVPGASVRVLTANSSIFFHRHFSMATGNTDDKGRLVVDFETCEPDKTASLQILVFKPGYLRKERMWYSDMMRGNVRRGGPIPEEMTVSLTKVAANENALPGKYSGKVVLWSGKAVSGATVTCTFFVKNDDQEKDGWTQPVSQGRAVTDANGNWTITADAPENCDSVHFRFEHPDYKPTDYGLETLRHNSWHTVLWKE